jgi:membrane protein
MRARLLSFVRRFVLGFRAHRGFEAAASIAFWFFLSFVPLLLLLGFLVGQVARSRGVDALLGPLLDVIPPSTEDLLRKELERMAGSTASVAPLGVAGYLWTASSGLHNLMDVFEATSNARGRPWWQQRVMALAWVAVGLLAAVMLALALVKIDAALFGSEGAGPAATTSASSASSSPPSASPTPGATTPAPQGRAEHAHSQTAVTRARGALRHRVHKALHTPAEQIVAAVLMLAIGLLLLAGFYRFAVEHSKGVRRRVWPGTFTAVGCWLVVSWAFGVYVVSMASYAFYYGSLAAVAVMLIWLYLTSLSLVVGAELNAQLERLPLRRKKELGVEPLSSGTHKRS